MHYILLSLMLSAAITGGAVYATDQTHLSASASAETTLVTESQKTATTTDKEDDGSFVADVFANLFVSGEVEADGNSDAYTSGFAEGEQDASVDVDTSVDADVSLSNFLRIGR